jgi:hypothetical protein
MCRRNLKIPLLLSSVFPAAIFLELLNNMMHEERHDNYDSGGSDENNGLYYYCRNMKYINLSSFCFWKVCQ